MAMDKEEARAKIAELVEKWRALSPAQVKSTYHEANTRKDFILPLFEALGWNTHDSDEVYEERQVGGGAVDYAFRINGVSRFFVEAKPLRDDLATHDQWVKQAVSYAYHKSVPYVALTNFKDLWVFNGDMRPQRFLALTADEYVAELDLLWLLSKEATLRGALYEFGRRHGALPPKVTVERRLYEQLSEWRERLFNELHKYEPHLFLSDVDETVLRLFNRLIFIRTCEDRQIEDRVLLPLARQFQERSLKGSLWDALKRVFADFDNGYDSELFQFHLLDQQAFFQDDTLADVIQGLYGPPGGLVEYDFGLIDADVLGRVYEQYLGHVTRVAQQRHRELQLRLGEGKPEGQAIEEVIQVIKRPQRRKAQGIYYTPQWVVDYIVRQTVGRFIEAHQQRPDAIHSMRILDPACGSGSFLIRAYEELLRWHARGRPAEWVFSDERLAILRENIYGVDMDQQAVEIARLNLLLRALRERQRLPELRENVRRGNSLIAGGEEDLRPFFGDAWREKHPFNWAEEFPRVMAEGGFDVVIGNPPYVRIQSLDRREADYYRQRYESAHGSFDLYVLFIEQGLRLLKSGGRLGFITSGKFLKAEYGRKLQQWLRREATVEEIVDLSAIKVFADATTYPVVLVVRKGAREDNKLRYVFVPSDDPEIAPEIAGLSSSALPQEAITGGAWPPQKVVAGTWVRRQEDRLVSLGSLWKYMFQGPVTGKDSVFILERRNSRLVSRQTRGVVKIEKELLLPLLKGSVHIHRYFVDEPELVLLFPYKRETGDKYQLIEESHFARIYPEAWEYLTENKKLLSEREHGRFHNSGWYGFSRPQNLEKVSVPKLLVPAMAQRLSFAYDDLGTYALVGSGGGGGGAYGIVEVDPSSWTGERL